MTPSIGAKEGKLWGTTQLVFGYNNVDAHVISIVKGGYCSKHEHYHKWNRFLVLSGRLLVRVFRADGGADETIIGVGEVSDVPPGVLHLFEALEDTQAVEFYWVELSSQDIDRHGTQGGVKEQQDGLPKA